MEKSKYKKQIKEGYGKYSRESKPDVEPRGKLDDEPRKKEQGKQCNQPGKSEGKAK